MKKTSAEGNAPFMGNDFRDYNVSKALPGGFQRSSSGTSFLGNASKPPPALKAPPTGNATAPTSSPMSQKPSTGMESLFKPLTQTFAGVGGLPALMSVYSMLGNNKDYQMTMSPNPTGNSSQPVQRRVPYQAPIPAANPLSTVPGRSQDMAKAAALTMPLSISLLKRLR